MSKKLFPEGVPQPTPPPAPAEQCDGCKFFRPTGDGEFGRCRRYPPGAGVLRALESGPLTCFPLVDYDSWCGEYVRRTS